MEEEEINDMKILISILALEDHICVAVLCAFILQENTNSDICNFFSYQVQILSGRYNHRFLFQIM